MIGSKLELKTKPVPLINAKAFFPYRILDNDNTQERPCSILFSEAKAELCL